MVFYMKKSSCCRCCCLFCSSFNFQLFYCFCHYNIPMKECFYHPSAPCTPSKSLTRIAFNNHVYTTMYPLHRTLIHSIFSVFQSQCQCQCQCQFISNFVCTFLFIRITLLLLLLQFYLILRHTIRDTRYTIHDTGYTSLRHIQLIFIQIEICI